MWPKTFDQRLRGWSDLRYRNESTDLDQALVDINDWWGQSPWTPYYLHWDDRDRWPDPWQLLEENVYCDLARGLGIMYTILLLNRVDIKDPVLFEYDNQNLVRVGREKYILNSHSEIGVNNNLEILKIKKSITGQQLRQKFNLG